MKLLLLFGVLVLLEIGLCSNAKKDRNRVKRKFPEAHHELSLDEHLSLRNGRQNKFHRYLKDWEKFSDPHKKWHKVDLKKKTHDKKNTVEKKGNKLHTEELKHIKLSHDSLHEKKINHPFTSKTNRRRENLSGRFSRKRQNRRGDKNHWKRKMHKYHKNRSFDKTSNIKSKDSHHMRFKDRMTQPLHHEFQRNNHFERRNNRRQNKANDLCKRLEKRGCPKGVKREICGSDGKTYENRCLYHKTVCKKGLTDPKSLSFKRGACVERKIIE